MRYGTRAPGVIRGSWHRSVPLIARQVTRVQRLTNNVRSVAGAVRSSGWVLEGEEPESGLPLRVLISGGHRQKDLIARVAFPGSCREISLGKVYAWQLMSLLRGSGGELDLAFIEGGRFHRRLFQSRSDFYLPLWVEGVADLPLNATTRGAKEDLRRMRKHALSCELRGDTPAIEDFYHNIYRPTVLERHGPDSHITALPELSRAIEGGDHKLLLINHDGRAIAGVVIVMTPCPRLWLGGVRDSKKEYRQMAAVGATYVFPARYLCEQGYRQMNLGRSRVFLNDGVLQYKNKWNQRICSHDPDGMILKPLSGSRSLRGFLARQPFVSIENGGLYANLFETPEEKSLVGVPDGLRGTRRYLFSENGCLEKLQETSANE